MLRRNRHAGAPARASTVVGALSLLLAWVPDGAAAQIQQPCRNGTPTGVHHVYSVCKPDADSGETVWFTVTDTYYRCPAAAGAGVLAFRTHEIPTGVSCEQPAPEPAGLVPEVTPGVDRSPQPLGVVVVRECRQGTWYEVTYQRFETVDGQVRILKPAIDLNGTGVLCEEEPPPINVNTVRQMLRQQAIPLGAADTGTVDGFVHVMPEEPDDAVAFISLADATPLDPNDNGRDPRVQLMIVELGERIVVSPATLDLPPASHPSLFSALRTLVARGTAPPASARAFPTASAAALRPAPLPTRPGGQAPTGPSAVRVFMTSRGASTGAAIDFTAVASGSEELVLSPGALVVEPLTDDAAARLREQAGALLRREGRSRVLDGYCLEFLRLPPEEADVFRIAPNSVQQELAPARRILDASRRLQRAGALNPDSEPDDYFHSIRQWAIWTREQGFDEGAFADAFVEHTRRNFLALGRDWSDRFEIQLRNAAPSRWQDIQQVLTAAGELEARR